MKVGIIELLVDCEARNWVERAYGVYFKRTYCSITPQAVAVWCRQLGHQVFYATFYGQKNPKHLLPDDLDVVFISTYTQASALAYALAKLYRAEKTLTVLGGPHAKSFPTDSLRFFDLVVKECDKELIGDILSGAFERRSIITSGRPLKQFPTVQERMPEIETAVFVRGRPGGMSIVPLLSSIGCPYSCDFCVDWNSPYVLLPPEQLEADLRYLSKHWPGVLVAYHDPNFGVKFDQVLNIIEKIPENSRNPYIMESSLSILRGERLQRLKDTKCVYIAPGVESWTNYSNKAGVGAVVGHKKLTQVVEHFRTLREYVPGLQANFMFGCEMDHGEEPVELTKTFIRALPYVWPTLNIPTPFGNTPLYDRALAQDKILKSMPFSFYYTPYLVTTMPNYPPTEYYQKLIDIYSVMTSARMLARRCTTKSTFDLSLLHALRTFSMRQDLAAFRQLHRRLKSDSDFRAFHEGRSNVLPEFYHHRFEEKLGRYASLVSRAERTPEMEKPVSPPAPSAALAA